MSRVSRVPYHQNVYDLLGIAPGESREAARMIAEHEAKHGPLPASVREWYLVPRVVSLWYEFSNQDRPESLEKVLAAVASPRKIKRRRFAQIVVENQAVVRWFLLLGGADDPPVWVANGRGDDPSDWAEADVSFSAFTSRWFAEYYMQEWTPISEYGGSGGTDSGKKPYVNGFWLRSPDEPFQPPVIDFLIDQFREPERAPRPGNVTTYTYRPPGGTIRVTADEPTLTGGLSAWWVHADTIERFAEFARLLLPWGTLRDTLRADTEEIREVLKSVRGV